MGGCEHGPSLSWDPKYGTLNSWKLLSNDFKTLPQPKQVFFVDKLDFSRIGGWKLPSTSKSPCISLVSYDMLASAVPNVADAFAVVFVT